MYHQKGFTQIFLILAVAVAALAGLGGYLTLSRPGGEPTVQKNDIVSRGESTRGLDTLPVEPEKIIESQSPDAALAPDKPSGGVKDQSGKDEFKQPAASVAEPTQPKPSQSQAARKIGLFGQQCEGVGDFKLKTFPIDAENIEFIQPMGRVQDSHVTPTNHQYIVPTGTKDGSFITDNPKKYQIKAPADGSIITIELFKQPVEEQYRDQPYQDNYLVVFEHTCDFYTRLIHIDTLSERVRSSFTFRDPNVSHPYASTRIPVKEGEVIGTVGSHSFDFQIIDAKVKNPKIINPKQLEEISVYTVETFAYLAEPLRSALLKKNLIQREPLGGTIAYDIPGKLAGNWFKVGRDRKRGDYWVDELSLVYDHFDPTQIRVSLGNFGGYPKAHGVRGNVPDPSTIGPDSGIVKYELVTFDYHLGGTRWDGIHFAQDLVPKNTNEVRGVVIFQLTTPTTLKVEVFPGTTAASVGGFTSAAMVYER